MGSSLAQRLQGKPVGVVLSAGYFGFFGHAGFLQALEDHGIKAACFSGTSAGALVAAMAAAGRPAGTILDQLCARRRADFWDPDPLGALAFGLKGPAATGLLRGAKLRGLLTRELPARFEDLQTPLAVVATNLTRNRAQVFTSGVLPARVYASCAYPGLFRAAEVDGELFWDGGLLDKAPIEALHKAFAPRTILVHYLPSRSVLGKLAGWAAYPRAMARAMAALREDHVRLQVEAVRARGVEVVLVTSELAALGPTRLSGGREVAAQARRKVAETLASSLDAPS